jgi:hypothetical protein
MPAGNAAGVAAAPSPVRKNGVIGRGISKNERLKERSPAEIVIRETTPTLAMRPKHSRCKRLFDAPQTANLLSG